MMTEKKFKSQLAKIDGPLKQLTQEVQILGVKLKEKDQEAKLNDLKIKELKKQVAPNKMRERELRNNMSADSRGIDVDSSQISE